MKKYVLLLVLGFYSFTAFALPNVGKDEIAQVTQSWGKLLAERNPGTIAALYAPDAYLYPTFGNTAHTPEEILNYFKKLSVNQDLRVKFDQENIRVFGDVAINSGIYTFFYKKDGKEVKVPARFTFVYLHKGNAWLIVEHHSSILPKS